MDTKEDLSQKDIKDLYIALAVTIMYFAPPVIGIVRDRMQVKKEKEKIEKTEKPTGKTEFGKQLYQPT